MPEFSQYITGNTMKKKHVVVVFAFMFLQVFSLSAQRIEIGLSPVAGVWNISQSGTKYGNSYGALIEFFRSDSSRLHFQIRYDYFEAKDEDHGGFDNSFQNLGVGVTYGIDAMKDVQIVGFTSVGFLAVQPVVTAYSVQSHWPKPYPFVRNVPSTTNLTLGLSLQYRLTKRFVPFIESSFINSIKINPDEKTKAELFAMRLGIRLKL